MNGHIVASPGIFFCVRDPLTSQIVTWRRAVDEAVMRYQLGRSSRIMVIGLQGQGLTHISEMPERGKFTPYYGMAGGGFTFTFHPSGDQTELLVEAIFSGSPIFHPGAVEPLRLAAPGMMYTRAEVYENIGTTGPDDAMTYMPEFLFGFYGEFLEIFRNWEWYSEDSEKYDFIFSPSSVGTPVGVRHRENGALLDLTRDFEW